MSLPFMPPEIRTHQVGGSHYAGKRIQPWDIILDHGLDYWEGNALKYLLRRKGNRLEDLRKARHYLDECIRQEEWRARLEGCEAGEAPAATPPPIDVGTPMHVVPGPTLPGLLGAYMFSSPASGSNAAGPSGLPPG